MHYFIKERGWDYGGILIVLQTNSSSNSDRIVREEVRSYKLNPKFM